MFKRISVLLAIAIVAMVGWRQSVEAKGVDDTKKQAIIEAYGKLPLYFIKNHGQVDERVRYYEKGSGQSMFFTQNGVYISLSRKEEKAINNIKKTSDRERDLKVKVDTVVLKLIGANKCSGAGNSSWWRSNSCPEIVAEEKLSGKVNYFIGNDPKKWKTDIPTYGKVRYKEIYPGIDLVFYGNQSQLEYDVVIKPGADPNVVKFEHEGVKELKVNKEGDLIVMLPSGNEIIQKRPHIYQEIDGRRHEVNGGYRVDKEDGRHLFSFELQAYNKDYSLIIDPVLSYSTYLGGSGGDYARAIAVDATGAAYVAGYTWSTNFPTLNAYQGDQGVVDAFVTKLSPQGNSLVYSTYLGGSNTDHAYAIAVDSTGAAYVTGRTSSTDFPTKNAYDNTCGTDGNCNYNYYGAIADAFVTKLTFMERITGDFNGDGFKDVLNRYGSTGAAILRQSKVTRGNWSGWQDYWAAWPVQYSEVYVGDFNGDGRDDILTRDPSNGDAVIRVSQVTGGNWSGWSNYWASWPVQYTEVYPGDYNGGGTDILTANPSGGSVMRQSIVSGGNWTGWMNTWAGW